jgi:hypothetical protein
VNAEQTSKRTQADPTAISGKADTAGRSERSKTPSRCAGVVATACTQGQHVHKESVSRSNIRRSWCGSPITVRRWSLIAAARRTPYTALPKSSGRRGRLHRPPVSTQRPISDRILTPLIPGDVTGSGEIRAKRPACAHDRAGWWDITRRHTLDRLPSQISLAGEGTVAAVPPPEAGDVLARIGGSFGGADIENVSSLTRICHGVADSDEVARV